MIPNYHLLPRIPDAGLLTRYADQLGIIVPAARTNMVLNPSLETNTTNWANTGVGTSIARSTEQQYHGAYSLKVTLDTGAGGSDDGAGYGGATGLSTTNGVTYAVSAKVRGVQGVGYCLMFGTSTVTPLARVGFTGTGRWQWVTLLYTETVTSTNRQIFIVRDGTGGSGASINAPIYIDGVQCEACAAGELWPTTYIDGDQLGLVANQYPPAYGWNGTPHASTSYRTGQTRAGGRVVRLKDYGFLLTAIIGLGMAPPQHQALTFAQLDGGQYQNTLKPPRTFSLAGRIAATTPTAADVAVSQLSQLVDRDKVALRQPLVLTMQAQECGVDCGAALTIPALYSGGLEGNNLELPTAQLPITFTQYLPYLIGHNQGAALTVQTSLANANYILQRSAGGGWSALGTGANNTVYVVFTAPDGTLYAGGAFTLMDGVANTARIAKWNGSAWTPLGTGGVGGDVYDIVAGPDGSIYAIGSFTSMGGVANTSRIAKWNGSAWSALGTGLNQVGYSMTFLPNGHLVVGGNFTLAGGVANTIRIARWDGAAWNAMGIGANVQVLDVRADGAGNVYAGGDFTTIGGVAAAQIAKWDGSAWSALGTGTNGAVNAIVIGPDGTVYIGGDFTTAGGTTVNYVARWNGQLWATMGVGTGGPGTVLELALQPNGVVVVVGSFASAGGVAVPDSIAFWSSGGWTYSDANLPGTATVMSADVTAQNVLTIGYNTSGSAIVLGVTTTVTNSGTVAIYPTITFNGPSSGTSRIYQLTNTVTGASIYFNFTINAGETAVLTLNPTNITFISTFRGNILSTILPGSTLMNFVLQPGANVIGFFADSSTVTAVIQSSIAYANLNDALYQAVAP